MSAAHGGHADIATVLLGHGASLELRNSVGMTALVVACQQNRLSVAELLLKHNAVVDATDKNDNTSLKIAAKHGHADVVKLVAGEGCEYRIGERCWVDATDECCA